MRNARICSPNLERIQNVIWLEREISVRKFDFVSEPEHTSRIFQCPEDRGQYPDISTSPRLEPILRLAYSILSTFHPLQQPLPVQGRG